MWGKIYINYVDRQVWIQKEKKLKKWKWIQIKAYPIKLENNDFPNRQDIAEAFVNMFAENSLSSNLNPSVIKFRKKEEKKKNTRTQFQTIVVI